MTTHTVEEVKESVKERYAAVARRETSCCAPAVTEDACCSPTEVRFTSKSEADAVVAESDLGLSCGSPTAFDDIAPGNTILDLGSGAGVDVFRAAELTGPEGYVIGVDMTGEMIDLARANAVRGGFGNVEFRLGEIEALPVVDGTVDVILSNCVINLVPDKQVAFAEMYRVLAAGGRFVISDIVTIGELTAETRADLSQWVGCISGAIDRDRYLALLEEAGFRDVEVLAEHGFGDEPPTQSITVRGFKR
jgi:SAM-dependent methyltransferase